jgi:hypothetical protein
MDIKEYPIVTAAEEDESAEISLAPINFTLNEESKALIEQIITETDEHKSRELTQLFNANQNKKTRKNPYSCTGRRTGSSYCGRY